MDVKGKAPQCYTSVVISDIHMSNRLPHARPSGKLGLTDRLEDQVGLWKRVRKTAREHNAHAVFIVGDLFDKSLVDAVTLTETVRAIADIGKPTYLLPGNHDAINTRGGRFTVEAFGAMGNANIHYMKTGERFSPADFPWLGFWPMEYCDQDTAKATLAAMQKQVRHLPDRKRKTEVCLLHQSIIGCKHVGWTCDDGLDADDVCLEFDRVISGHFHDHQLFGPGGKGMYLSAPMHHRFDDEGRQAGYWVMDFSEDGTVEQSFIDGGCPRFHELEWPAVAVKTIAKKMAVGDYVRINCTATTADWQVEKGKILELVEQLRGLGYKATYKHKPLYHHTRRIKASKLGADPTLKPEAMMEAYLDAPDVDKGDLDLELLKRIGRAALEAAKAKVA